MCQHRKHAGEEEIHEEEPEGNGHSNGLNRAKKKRRFRSSRRARGSTDSRGAAGVHNNPSVASNSFAQCSRHQKYRIGDGREEDSELDVTRAPRNGCGIPWNWSRIHHRGKTILDIAGRSLSCGMSDSRLRKAEGPIPQVQGDNSNMAIASDHLTSSTNSDSEALPLLVEPLGSHESPGNGFLVQDYSGELGIYANHGLRHERDSDLASEARSGNPHKSRGRRQGRHRSLTQKYYPKTFKGLVGQNLVVQALSNAVLRRKVGLVYVFYGPQGTGKTSCARVFAKALNCQSAEHPKPCDICSSCILHNLGKSRNVLEVGPLGNLDCEAVLDVLDSMLLSPLSSQYRVLIVDDCDTLAPDCWSAISKVIDRAPRHVVFVLISSNLDHLPHIIISRCQKFYFPKLKDSDIICTLQLISSSEGLEIDKDALKLIASRSDGSLRDAEMTLDQLSLLGQRISLPLVQELVGLVSDEKLVDLLDLALSADTVNTVKNLRQIMNTGAEPLALMSQLATIITDILAGSYVFTQERLRRKFFRRPTLSKEEMEKLRQALKTLSEAEKQLRVSNDKLTWLTAALLQLAPDQQYMLPNSSTDASFNHSPMVLNNTIQREIPWNSTNAEDGMLVSDRSLSRGTGLQNRSCKGANDVTHGSNKMISSYASGKGHVEETQTLTLSTMAMKVNEGYKCCKSHKNTEKVWRAVLENIQSDTLEHFLYQEGKLNSVSYGAAPTVQLLFSSHVSKSKAEKFRGQILQAFESVLCSSVILEIRCESKKDVRPDVQVPLVLPVSENGSSQMTMMHKSITNQRPLCPGSESFIRRLPKENGIKGIGFSQARRLHSDPLERAKGEIVETVASPQENEHNDLTDNTTELKKKGLGSVWVEGSSSSQHHGNLVPLAERREGEEQLRRQSLVRSKVSLAHVIQQAEGCAQRGVWSRRKAMSIAEKLEQENLRLEPRSRSLLCWRASRITRGKLPRLRIRTRKQRSLLKLVTCGRCLCARSPK